ncbi:transmembrane signal receptor [Lithospermum erythrorhizon]|uniref:Transmembrane signal receptor n=1 Tax=Lithospermum erythrorhizon TaxID=34254 RepID=A0AAV3Q8N1_LITER
MVIYITFLKILIAVCVLYLYMVIVIAQTPELWLSTCPNTTTYNQNSTYRANLSRLLSDFTSNNATNNLFFNATVGNNAPDVVYGLVLCRGDITSDACRECLGIASREIIQSCPKEKESIIWDNVSDPDRFDQVLWEVMDRLINRATGRGNVGSLKGFATGESDYTSIIKMYYLVQCTPDLSSLQSPPPSLTLSPPPAPHPPPPLAQVPDIVSGGNGGISAVVIVAIGVPIIVSTILLSMAFCFLRRKAKKLQNVMIDTTGGADENVISATESLQYDLSNMKAATNNFSADNKIGKGGFGQVFQGTLNGKQIAVKRLSKSSGQGEKILIYEFVPNKSLDFILFDEEKQQSLDWSRRYKIIGGVARGMLYLHEDSRLRIIHRDLKASNVLLDSDMNAKIADFGLSRIVGVDESHVKSSHVAGTLGYMLPENMHGHFSMKSDVFSFGILVLEIISGKKNNRFYRSSDHLLSRAWMLWRDRRPFDLVDPTLGKNFARNEVIRCIHMGLLCVQKDPEKRPTMASVGLMLSSYSVTLPVPHYPAFFLDTRTTRKSSSFSANEVSITELSPR